MVFIFKTKFFLILFLLWAGFAPAQAQMLCRQIHEAKQATPKLYDLLKQPFSQRMARSDLSQKLSQKMKASMQEAMNQGTLEGALGFSSPLEIWGQFQEVNGDTLRINLVQLYLRTQGSAMSIGERTPGLSLQFAAVMRASLEACQFWVSRHPEVQKIEFLGNEIQSPFLPEILRRLGFKSSSNNGESMRLLIDVRS